MRYFNQIVFKLILCLFFINASIISGFSVASETPQADKLQLALFEIDVTLPLGSRVNYKAPVYQEFKNTWDMGLRAKGVVLTGSGQPVVLLAIDWLAISMECHDAFQRELAEAAGTTPEHP